MKSYVHRNRGEIEFEYAVTYKFASGGMVSTAEDLARFGIALLHGKLLKPETLALMWKPALDKDVLQYTEGEKPTRMSFQQGFGWRLMTDKK